jgi:hypothetical protein
MYIAMLLFACAYLSEMNAKIHQDEKYLASFSLPRYLGYRFRYVRSLGLGKKTRNRIRCSCDKGGGEMMIVMPSNLPACSKNLRGTVSLSPGD